MSLARISEIETALVAKIAAWWDPTAPDEVLAPVDFDIAQKEILGRKVIVFADSYTGSPASRADDTKDYRFQIWVVERYTPQGQPTKAWVQERMFFTASLADAIGEPRSLPYLLADAADPTTGYRPESAEVDGVYDTADLVEHKLFVSSISLTLRGEETYVPPEE